MFPSERSPQGLSEAILTFIAPCEEIVKFRHTLLVRYFFVLFDFVHTMAHWLHLLPVAKTKKL